MKHHHLPGLPEGIVGATAYNFGKTNDFTRHASFGTAVVFFQLTFLPGLLESVCDATDGQRLSGL